MVREEWQAEVSRCLCKTPWNGQQYVMSLYGEHLRQLPPELAVDRVASAPPAALRGHQMLSNHAQIMSNQAQPYPAFQAPVAVEAAAGPLIRPSMPARQLRPAWNHACCSYAIRLADLG